MEDITSTKLIEDGSQEYLNKLLDEVLRREELYLHLSTDEVKTMRLTCMKMKKMVEDNLIILYNYNEMIIMKSFSLRSFKRLRYIIGNIAVRWSYLVLLLPIYNEVKFIMNEGSRDISNEYSVMNYEDPTTDEIIREMKKLEYSGTDINDILKLMKIQLSVEGSSNDLMNEVMKSKGSNSIRRDHRDYYVSDKKIEQVRPSHTYGLWNSDDLVRAKLIAGNTSSQFIPMDMKGYKGPLAPTGPGHNINCLCCGDIDLPSTNLPKIPKSVILSYWNYAEKKHNVSFYFPNRKGEIILPDDVYFHEEDSRMEFLRDYKEPYPSLGYNLLAIKDEWMIGLDLVGHPSNISCAKIELSQELGLKILENKIDGSSIREVKIFHQHDIIYLIKIIDHLTKIIIDVDDYGTVRSLVKNNKPIIEECGNTYCSRCTYRLSYQSYQQEDNK